MVTARVFGLILIVLFHGAQALSRDCPILVGTLVFELPQGIDGQSPTPAAGLFSASALENSKLMETVSIGHAAADGALGAAVHSAGIIAFDLSDPSQPEVLGFSPQDAWTAPTWSPPRCVAVSGHHAFVCDYYNDQLVVFDLSDPGAIEPVAYVQARDVNDIVIRGSLAYVAGTFLQIIDISDPGEPVMLGEASVSGWRSFVAVEFPYAYFTEWTEGLFTGLTVVDVSDPSNPLSLGEAFRGELYCCGPVAVAESVVYVADSPVEDMAHLHVVDAGNPWFPREVPLDDWITATSLEVVGTALLVSSDPYLNPPVEGVSEYDISEPGQLEIVGHQDIPRGNITAAGGLALIASGGLGVQIVRPCGSGLRILTDDLVRSSEGR